MATVRSTRQPRLRRREEIDRLWALCRCARAGLTVGELAAGEVATTGQLAVHAQAPNPSASGSGADGVPITREPSVSWIA